MDKWISVKDRLPEEGGEYWCKNDNAQFPAFYARNALGIRKWLKVNEDLVISHWMPLPKPPKK